MNQFKNQMRSAVLNKLHHHRCRHASHCGSGKALFALGLVAGSLYGLLFARTSGAELRAKLRKSDSPLLDFWRASEETKLEVIDMLAEKCRGNKANRSK